MKWLIALVASWAVCEPTFDPCLPPRTEVSGLQILAVRADPPEAVLAADGSAPTVTVTVLAVDQIDLDHDADVTVTMCPETETKLCAGGESFRARLPLGGLSFAVHPSAELLRSALASDPLLGYGGIRVQLQIDLATSMGNATAAKLLIYSHSQNPNHAFEITGVEVTRLDHTNRELQIVNPPPDHEILRPGEVLQLDVGDAAWLHPVLSPGAAEEYDTVDLSGRPVHLREEITYDFYSTPHLGISAATATEAPVAPGLTAVTYLHVRGGGGTLWIIARDSRGAQAWLPVTFYAGDDRACSIVVGGGCALLELSCKNGLVQ